VQGPSARDRFRDEDLADMLCSLRLPGELALRPLMMATGKNIWQLTLLGQ
jgi:hypothetical protein